MPRVWRATIGARCICAPRADPPLDGPAVHAHHGAAHDVAQRRARHDVAQVVLVLLEARGADEARQQVGGDAELPAVVPLGHRGQGEGVRGVPRREGLVVLPVGPLPPDRHLDELGVAEVDDGGVEHVVGHRPEARAVGEAARGEHARDEDRAPDGARPGLEGVAPVLRRHPGCCPARPGRRRTRWPRRCRPTRKGTRLSPWKTPTIPRPRFAGRRRIVRRPSSRAPSSITGAASPARPGAASGCTGGVKPRRSAARASPVPSMRVRVPPRLGITPSSVVTVVTHFISVPL